MPQGQPAVVPDDGLTTRQRRNRAILAVHTGVGKGKSTAAFGMVFRALGNGMKVGVVQFVKGKWETGERAVLEKFPEKPMSGEMWLKRSSTTSRNSSRMSPARFFAHSIAKKSSSES